MNSLLSFLIGVVLTTLTSSSIIWLFFRRLNEPGCAAEFVCALCLILARRSPGVIVRDEDGRPRKVTWDELGDAVARAGASAEAAEKGFGVDDIWGIGPEEEGSGFREQGSSPENPEIPSLHLAP